MTDTTLGPRSRRLLLAGLLGQALLLTATAVASYAQASASATVDTSASAEPGARLRSDVGFLASEELAGRLTGTQGERQAAEFLAERLRELGVEPLVGDDLLVPFDFTSGTSDDGSSLRVAAHEQSRSWSDTDHVQALSFSDTAAVSGEVVFAGYGLVVPESQDFGYDSYATLDVEGKIVVALRYFPEDLEGEARATLARYSGLRYKAMTAREHGARALLLVTGPASPNAGETIPMTFDTAIAGSGIVAASISAEVAAALFDSVPGQDLATAQQALDSGNPHVAGFALPGIEVALDVKVKRERRTGYNVVGRLGGETDRGHPLVVAGAHYDHLGRGRSGNSLARKEEAGEIHYGADDNASGVAALLEMTRLLSESDLGRDVAVAFWSGEELGLLGSTAFVRDRKLSAQEVAAYVNLDMVGRMRDNRLTVQAVGSSPTWPRLIEQSNFPVGFDINTQDDPYLPTDSAAFNTASIPSLNLFTGSHEDYHRPSDRAPTLNYEDLARIARFGSLLVGKLSRLEESPAFVAVERKTQEGGDRDSVRAYTGTIPDYTTEVEGLRLGGVVGGGPADEAGLKEGDVIVEMGGQSIANIYDYTYALDAVKVDVPVEVVFLRNGERMETTITPRSRK